MSDDKQSQRPLAGDVDLVTPPDLAVSLPSGVASLTEDENQLVGTVILDRYLVQSIAGRGGMSVVYKAQHLLLKRSIALKLLHKQLSNQARHIQRFKVEAQAASRLAHENIVSVYDFGALENDCTFLAMEYVEGKQLAEIITEERHFQLQRAIELTLQCCSALQHAHENGIIHRDLKPSNVIICQSDKGTEMVKIVDFGIAKVFEEDQNLTKTGETVGSPPYMSPEQCRGDETLDARSDIYSLGCLFYEMLCGKAPLTGGTVYETIHKQISEMPRSISHTRDDIKAVAEVDEVLLTALAKNPQARYQSMSEFRDALLHLREQTGGVNSLSSKLSSRWNVFRRRYVAGRQNDYKPLKAALVMAALLAAAAGAAVYYSRPATDPAQTAFTNSLEQDLSPTDKYDKIFATQMQVAGSLMDQGKPAVKELEQACTAGLTAFGEQDARYLRALKNLKSQYLLANRTNDARRVADELNRIERFLTPLGDPLSNSSKIQALIVSMQSDQKNKTTVHELITTLTNQAELLGGAGRHKEAQTDAAQAIALAEKYFPGDTLAIRPHILNGRLLRWLGRNDLASQEYKNVAALASTKKGSEAMIGYANLALGDDAYWSKHFQNAVPFYEAAISHFRAFYKGPSPQEADALEALSKCQSMQNQPQLAVQTMERALEMSRLVEGPHNHSLGKRTANLGWIYFHNRDWPHAEVTLKQSMQMLYGTSWGDNLVVARAAAALGHVYLNEKKYDLAEPYLKQALLVFARNDRRDEKDFYKDAPREFIECSQALMQIYRSQKRWKDITKLGDLVKRAQSDSQANK